MPLSEILSGALVSALIYPGFFFIVSIGILAETLRRKLALRGEGRRGGPWLQPLYELLWRIRRPTIVPGPTFPDPELLDEEPARREMAQLRLASKNRQASTALIYLPVMALLGVVLGTVLIPVPGNPWPFLRDNLPSTPLGTDLLGAALLLELPVMVTIIFGSFGGSVYSQLAGSRTAQMAVAYLIPYCIAVFGPALALKTLDFRVIAAADTPVLLGIKFICGLLWLVCLPARLRLRPLAAASGEALEGVLTDISGPPLALYRLMEWTERAALPLFGTVLFIPYAGRNPLVLAGGWLLTLGIVAVIDAFFSQVRLRDALNFYLRYASLGAFAWFLMLALLFRI